MKLICVDLPAFVVATSFSGWPGSTFKPAAVRRLVSVWTIRCWMSPGASGTLTSRLTSMPGVTSIMLATSTFASALRAPRWGRSAEESLSVVAPWTLGPWPTWR